MEEEGRDYQQWCWCVLLHFLQHFLSKILFLSILNVQKQRSVPLSYSTERMVLLFLFLLCVMLRRNSVLLTKFLITLKVNKYFLHIPHFVLIIKFQSFCSACSVQCFVFDNSLFNFRGSQIEEMVWCT